MAVGGAHCLAALSELERRFDGPIPELLRRSTLLGHSLLPLRLVAEAQVCFFTSLIRGQIATIRQRRRDGSFYAQLVADLAFYRERRQLWRRELVRLRRLAETAGITDKICDLSVSTSATSGATVWAHDMDP
ncbi:MAG TPA: hypothetical protein VGU20_03130 [Stellaceae bacterium]|nr:hypothetical protein [Stellaceae bacterium]